MLCGGPSSRVFQISENCLKNPIFKKFWQAFFCPREVVWPPLANPKIFLQQVRAGSLQVKNLKLLLQLLASFDLDCCVFWPAFWCCMHPKAGRNTFFSHFQPVLSAFACQPAIRSSRKSLFCSYQTFFVDFRHKITEKDFKLTKKGWKLLKKSVSTSFWVCAAPKAGQNTQHLIHPYFCLRCCTSGVKR